MVTLLGSTSAGSAATDSLSVSTVPSQPTDAAPLQVAASGTTAASGDTLYIRYRPAGTGACGVDPSVDSGSAVPPDGTNLGTSPFSVQGAPQTFPIGSYVLCGWLTDPNDATVVLATAQTAFTVTAADSLSLAAPTNAIAGQPFDLTAQGVAYDGNAVVDATYKQAGATCASSPGADTGTVPSGSGIGAGTGSYSATVFSQQVLDAGSYLVCAWLVDQQYPTPLIATSETITVHPVQASLQILIPAKVDGGQPFNLTLNANVSANVPLTAVADLKPKRSGSRCASNPAGEPSSAVAELSQQVTDTRQPAGKVSATDNQVTTPSYGTYLVCAWLLAGWTNAQNPPTVAGPISTTVTALRPEVFRGRTSQHLGIKITVAPVENLVLDIIYSDHLHCPGSPTFSNGLRWTGVWNNELNTNAFGTVRIGKAGKFHANLNGNRNHTFKVSGRLKRSRINGTLSEQGKAFVFTGNQKQSSVCRTGTVRYSVRLG
jgi:hypothetical protein